VGVVEPPPRSIVFWPPLDQLYGVAKTTYRPNGVAQSPLIFYLRGAKQPIRPLKVVWPSQADHGVPRVTFFFFFFFLKKKLKFSNFFKLLIKL
jgi:hypothetical protein